VRKFFDQVALSEADVPADSVTCFKGFRPIYPSHEIHEAFASTVDKYQAGVIVDAIAILKAMHAVSENKMGAALDSISRINEQSTHAYLKENMDIIRNSDKLKVAVVIADTLGVPNATGSAESIINLALRNARKNSMMTRGESMKIIERMLELANTVGIKYDKSILKVAEPEQVDEGILNKIAGKVMGVEPKTPAYRVGQTVKYQSNMHQPDWKNGGKGVGVITAHKNGHYIIDDNPVNHFEIKSVVEAEELDELSVNTLKSYKEKALDSANKLSTAGLKSKNLQRSYEKTTAAAKRLGNVSTATNKVAKKDWNQKIGITEGSDIQVNHESGKKLFGKLKGKHGSVYEIKYGNGKVGFHHSHKCELLNELQPKNEAVEIKTFSDLKQEKVTPEDTEKNLMYAKKKSAGIVDTVTAPTVEQGTYHGATSDTNRHQLIRKLKGL
jgi:hypothetical protein